MRRTIPPGISRAACGMSQGMPSSLARMFAVPAGSSAIGTWLPARPLTTSLIVPSPPQAITMPRRCSTACRAIVVAEPAPVVGASSVAMPASFKNARGLLDFGEAAMPPPAARRVVDQQRVFDSVRHSIRPEGSGQTRIV